MADAASRQASRAPAAAEPDLDQVEAAFVDGFIDAPDPTSFLRLGRIPFEMIATDGAKLNLLRVEIDAVDRCRQPHAASRRRLVPLRSAAGEPGLAAPAPALRLF